MWNPFKRKFRVPVNDCINIVIGSMEREDALRLGLWDWLEAKGAKREWSHFEQTNYLVFDSKKEYHWFLLKL